MWGDRPLFPRPPSPAGGLSAISSKTAPEVAIPSLEFRPMRLDEMRNDRGALSLLLLLLRNRLEFSAEGSGLSPSIVLARRGLFVVLAFKFDWLLPRSR